MRTKNFVIFLLTAFTLSMLFIAFGQHKPETIQSIVSTTHEHLRSLKDNFRGAESRKLVTDEKYLKLLDLSDNPRLFPNDIWRNTSLPVFVTYVIDGQESQVIGLISNIARILPNNTVLVYNLGLDRYSLKTLLNYCNSSRCQVITYSLSEFPSHIDSTLAHAYRALVIQDALKNTGAIFFIENSYRFLKQVSHETIINLYNDVTKNQGILAWPMTIKNPVSSLTHKKMFEYFHTDAESFYFLRMVLADVLILVNTETIHKEIMLPWVQCALTQDCIIPIGAQSVGCRFDKKPQFRYSGCHSYDASALNIVLGLKFKLDGSKYTFNEDVDEMFEIVSLWKAEIFLKEMEQNSTTERTMFDSP